MRPVRQDGCEAASPRCAGRRAQGAGWGCAVHRRRKGGPAPRPRDPEAGSCQPRTPASPRASRARAPHAQGAGSGRADQRLQRLPGSLAADRSGCARARRAGPTAERPVGGPRRLAPPSAGGGVAAASSLRGGVVGGAVAAAWGRGRAGGCRPPAARGLSARSCSGPG